MIEASSATCPAGEGSGFVFAPQHVLTNAHVVAATAGAVVMDGRHARYAARVVYFDPRRDIAVLYVPGLHARPLRFAASASPGSDAIVAGHPLGMPLTPAPARIGAKVAIGFPSIYGGRPVTRHVYPVRADIQPGNSGSPLLKPDGSVYGMVFGAFGHAEASRTAAASTQPWHCPA
jgi:S1-C subfamily serine protease